MFLYTKIYASQVWPLYIPSVSLCRKKIKHFDSYHRCDKQKVIPGEKVQSNDKMSVEGKSMLDHQVKFAFQITYSEEIKTKQ